MNSPTLTPDSILHIYYLQGRIAQEEKIVNENYLGTWYEEGFSFIFFNQPSSSIIDELIAENEALTLIDTYEMAYEQWQGGEIGPTQIGSFLITPPWFTPPEGEPSTIITLDPGVVFGNGLHPTTQDCLVAIDIACAGQKVSTMLDLGCGTGILALAAANRGCGKALAVDSNLLASKTTLRNVKYNGLENSIMVINGDAVAHCAAPTDLLVANIHYDIMKKIIASEGFLQQKWFILSGLLTSEAEKIQRQLADLPVLILQKWQQNTIWHTFLGITEDR